MPVRLCCIVEGHGEVKSVPALIHRICIDHKVSAPIVHPPIRWDRHRLMKPGEAERAVQVALKFAGASGGVLVLVDADDDCRLRSDRICCAAQNRRLAAYPLP